MNYNPTINEMGFNDYEVIEPKSFTFTCSKCCKMMRIESFPSAVKCNCINNLNISFDDKEMEILIDVEGAQYIIPIDIND